VECGATVSPESSCQDHFHALLCLEAEVPGAPGELPHFYAVASYALQHPDSMNLTIEALRGLRQAVTEELDGGPNLDDLRRRARWAAANAGRVTRRGGEEVGAWPRGEWPVTVADVCDVSPGEYIHAVSHWARSVRETLDEHSPPGAAKRASSGGRRS
jgi:hypothetical protein